jgi:bla regulator protein BlaR1
MLAWMLYVIVVSLLLALAALALERAARIRRKRTRWLWGASMTASLLLPLLVSAVAGVAAPITPITPITPLARDVAPAMPARVVALPSGWLTATAGRFPASPDLDRLLQLGWGAASAILLLTLLAGHVQLKRRRRGWARGEMAGVAVHVSQDAGPAIVGLWNPQIVVPRWLMQSPAPVQELVIAHEQSHLDAHDARLTTLALGLIVCMPWNLPLWWQLRRLRCAVEIDCDARVLRRGHDVARYGETLIAVAERQSAAIALVPAMAEPRSWFGQRWLEQRLRTMLRRDTRCPRASAIVLACLGTACAVGAAELTPPSNDDADRHVGFYQLNDHAVFTISRTGAQLNAQLTGQASVPLFARSATAFSYKDKSISFVTAPDGQTTSLILRQYGIDMAMPRIDGATAREIASFTNARRYRPQPERYGALIILQ